MAASSKPSEWLTRKQAAEHAQVTVRTLAKWIADGELDIIKIGGGFVRITPEALADLQWRRTRRAVENKSSRSRRQQRRAS